MKFFIKQSWLIVFFLLSIVCRSISAEEPNKKNLTPLQREQIQIVSQAILASKRQTEPSSESLAIRKQIKLVRSQLNALILPTGTVKLTLQTDKNTLSSSQKRGNPVASFAEEGKQQVWHKIHSNKIQRLNKTIGQLKTLCDKEVNNRKSLQPGLLQRLKTYYINPQSPQASHVKQNTVITTLSSSALTQLSNLQIEINNAIALPEQERHQQLLVLSKRLKISQQPSVFTENEDNGKEFVPFKNSTPTMISRTSHRRKF